MPSIVTALAFRRAILSWIGPNLTGYRCRLFVNNYVPLVSSLASDFTEPSGSWYAPIILNAWGMPFVNAANQGQIDETIRTWIASGTVVSEQVYGYFITTPTGLLTWAEQVPGSPLPMNIPGLKVQLIPRLMAGALC